MPIVTVTFIRHGESTDNLHGIWAGWKDAPLSNHGMNQARAAGNALSSTRFAAIYASPLLRAHTTAKAIHDAQQEPKPPVTISPLLREQHFGIAEGHEWTAKRIPGLSNQDHFDRSIFPIVTGRDEKFPEGESLNDLKERAEKAIDQLVMPHVRQALKDGKGGVDIALVSHGLCISELVAALVRKDSEIEYGDSDRLGGKYVGLLNTAWTKISIDAVTTSGPSQSTEAFEATALNVRVTDVNRHEHLETVKRQRGIGSSPFDPNQTNIRNFFGGGKVISEEGRSESNVRDEVGLEQ